jgi:hypothetical protein
MVTKLQRRALTKEGYRIIGMHFYTKEFLEYICTYWIYLRESLPRLGLSLLIVCTYIYILYVYMCMNLGTHSAVKLCRWTKNQMRGRGGCYKHTFYGITSYQCMEVCTSVYKSTCVHKYLRLYIHIKRVTSIYGIKDVSYISVQMHIIIY